MSASGQSGQKLPSHATLAEEHEDTLDYSDGGQMGDDQLGFILDTEPSVIRSPKKKRRKQQQRLTDSDRDNATPAFTLDTEGQPEALHESRAPPIDWKADEKETTSSAAKGENSGVQEHKPPSSLLLPEHVQIAPSSAEKGGLSATSSREPASPGLDQDEIDGHLGDFTQLDGDVSGVSRYYDVTAAEERKALKECEICGEKGHTKRDCSHLLCASCGATDEHSTRECPVGVSCFRCGQRGHRRTDCKADLRQVHRSRDCRRCGSLNHAENTCPTYWRIYAYVEEEEWKEFRARKAAELRKEQEERGGTLSGPSTSARTRRARADESDMDTGSDSSDDGGYGSHQKEPARRRLGKITPPRRDWDPAVRWCYNCAAKGTHWGDDCPLPRRARNRNGEPSIFSEFVSLSGPFAHYLEPPPRAEPMAPVADMYDVSVGPGASMHFSGSGGRHAGIARGDVRSGRERPSVEEEVDRIFARAPRASQKREERERARDREWDRRRRDDTNYSSGKKSQTSTGPATGNGMPMGTTNGVSRKTGPGPAAREAISDGSSFNHRAQQQRSGANGNARPQAIVISSDDESDDDFSFRSRARKPAKQRGKKPSLPTPTGATGSLMYGDTQRKREEKAREMEKRRQQSQRDKQAHQMKQLSAAAADGSGEATRRGTGFGPYSYDGPDSSYDTTFGSNATNGTGRKRRGAAAAASKGSKKGPGSKAKGKGAASGGADAVAADAKKAQRKANKKAQKKEQAAAAGAQDSKRSGVVASVKGRQAQGRNNRPMYRGSYDTK